MGSSMKIYVISDSHLGHNKIISLCGRPGNFEQLIFDSFSEIEDNSLLIHLGDFCFKDLKNWHNLLKEFNFRKVLVKGNHDQKSKMWYMENGWDLCVDMFAWRMNGKRFLFSHKPLCIGENEYNIHGHLHFPVSESEGFRFDGTDLRCLTKHHYLVSSELLNYKPILLDKIVSDLASR